MATNLKAFLRLRSLASHLQPTGLRSSTTLASALAQRVTYYPAATMATQAIPKTMKGVLVEKTGGVEVLHYRTDLPVPEPGEGQLLIKNEVSGINYIDTSVVAFPYCFCYLLMETPIYPTLQLSMATLMLHHLQVQP